MTDKMLAILQEVAEACEVAVIIGDYKKANGYLDILEAAKKIK